MSSINKEAIDWTTVERGVPITNDSYFVRHEKETGLIYDDRGGYIHQNYCYIENRREVTWIQHDQSTKCPTVARDLVLVESLNGEIHLTSAYLVIWSSIRRYRVVRQQLSTQQTKVTSEELNNLNQSLFSQGRILSTLVVIVSALLI